MVKGAISLLVIIGVIWFIWYTYNLRPKKRKKDE